MLLTKNSGSQTRSEWPTTIPCRLGKDYQGEDKEAACGHGFGLSRHYGARALKVPFEFVISHIRRRLEKIVSNHEKHGTDLRDNLLYQRCHERITFRMRIFYIHLLSASSAHSFIQFIT